MFPDPLESPGTLWTVSRISAIFFNTLKNFCTYFFEILESFWTLYSAADQVISFLQEQTPRSSDAAKNLNMLLGVLKT